MKARSGSALPQPRRAYAAAEKPAPKAKKTSDAELRRQCELANEMDKKTDDGFFGGLAVWP